MHSVKDFTRHKLEHMKASGSPPANLDRDSEAAGDDYGQTAARTSSSAQFKHGGHAEHGKKPHMGRAHRAHGGGILGRKHDITKPTAEPIRQGDSVKLAKGGRAHHEAGGGVRGEGARDAENDAKTRKMNVAEKDQYANEKRGGRIHRASGGRAKGKTVVNVIIAGGKGQQSPPPGPMPTGAIPPPPPPMAGPPPAPPPHPMPMMPSGGAPMGPMGAPPGGMPMRAHGGKVDGHKDFGRGGVKGGQSVHEGGGGGGRGRLQKAAAEGAHYPRGE